MTVYVNNVSAMHAWCMVAYSAREVGTPSKRTVIGDANGTASAYDTALASGLSIGKRPLHVFVNDAKQRSQSAKVHSHVYSGTLPRGALYSVCDTVLVSSPELSFCEMTGVLPFAKLIEYGCLLCGTYTVNPDAEEKNKRQPLTTKKKIASFIERLEHFKGKATARRALKYVLENSASPRESKLALLLTLPARVGGYGFDEPLLNYEIVFNEYERSVLGVERVVLDLYWHDHAFGIEYDGRENHSEEPDVSYDRLKSSNLLYSGITIIRVDKRQLESPAAVLQLARKIARALGQRVRSIDETQWQAKCSLFETLMHGTLKSQ